MRVECAPRACTSWSTAAAALMWPVCEFLAAGCWAATQSSTGVTLIRRCAGLPMHHELLSTTALALALLQHPSPLTCPHTLPQRWHAKNRAAEIASCRLCFACRWDPRRQSSSFWWTTPPPCLRYFTLVPTSRRWTCCRCMPPQAHVLWRAAGGGSRACS